MSNFDKADKFHFQAAQGWIELGNHIEANAELDEITPELRAHPDVLELRLEIYLRGKLWSACIEVGNTLIQLRPKKWMVSYRLACAYAQLDRLDEAKTWFQKAMAIDEQTVKRKAIDDDDLKPLWDSMGGTMWRKE